MYQDSAARDQEQSPEYSVRVSPWKKLPFHVYEKLSEDAESDVLLFLIFAYGHSIAAAHADYYRHKFCCSPSSELYTRRRSRYCPIVSKYSPSRTVCPHRRPGRSSRQIGAISRAPQDRSVYRGVVRQLRHRRGRKLDRLTDPLHPLDQHRQEALRVSRQLAVVPGPGLRGPDRRLGKWRYPGHRSGPSEKSPRRSPSRQSSVAPVDSINCPTWRPCPRTSMYCVPPEKV